MSKVPQQDLESWIQECAEWMRRAESTGYAIPRENNNDFMVLFGVIARTIRYAETFLELALNGKVNEASPLARAVLEHAVTAQWVFNVEGGADRWRRTVQHDRHRYFKLISEWNQIEEIREGVERMPEPPSGKQLPKFMDMLRELDHEHFLETSYMILSERVHVTHAVIVESFEQDTEGNTRLSHPREDAFIYPAVYVTALSCMLVRWILSTLTDDADDLKLLDGKSDELQIPMTLIHKLPTEKRRKGLD